MYWLIPLAVSFCFTLYMIPKWIFRAKMAKLAGKDLHKKGQALVSEVGGLPVISGFILAVLIYIAINVFIYDSQALLGNLFAAATAILIATIIGLVDDILGWRIGLRQLHKAMLTIAITIPIVAINAGDTVMNFPFFGMVNLGFVFTFILVPLGIVATSNAFNMVAGYNGLEAGMGIILLTTLSIIVHYQNQSWLSIIGMCMVFSLIAFLFYNWHPARIFPGDTMTYSVGALFGIMVILGNIEKFGMVLFSLYILQFFLKARSGFKAESFGKLNPDGSIFAI
jgi:UDP-N-acetylglucosamine--dolichyl-phosphate N-acetylglucosaminephosphotransferase